MHDDQHGTAVVVLAGLINAWAAKNPSYPPLDPSSLPPEADPPLAEKLRGAQKGRGPAIVMNGAGAAGLAVTDLLLQFGLKDITVCDSKGIVSEDRTDLSAGGGSASGGNKEKVLIAKRTNPRKLTGGLVDALRGADVFIGVSKGNVLTADMVHMMNTGPIIFALANPTPEIMPDIAKAAGAFIVATGRSDFPNQLNNVLAFPGIFRGALDNKVLQITDAMLMNAARALARCVGNPSPEKILPDVFDKNVVKAVAGAIR
jgi:malate dehydrogenase (oxaloacetate-decarboxylating)